MLILTIGFSSVSLLLGLNFFRKYASRLSAHNGGNRYSRIADYHGRPIHLHFDYQLEDGKHWEAVETEVDEIFHYGPDYFLRGNAPNHKSARLYQRNRIANLKMDGQGPEIKVVKNLLVARAEMSFKDAA